jgi:hypothetical protein
MEARLMEKALREPLGGMGMSFFAIGHEDGSYDVMGDSGANARTFATRGPWRARSRRRADEIRAGQLGRNL